MPMFASTKEKIALAVATPEIARTGAILACIALAVALLALGVAIGKGPANAH